MHHPDAASLQAHDDNGASPTGQRGEIERCDAAIDFLRAQIANLTTQLAENERRRHEAASRLAAPAPTTGSGLEETAVRKITGALHASSQQTFVMQTVLSEVARGSFARYATLLMELRKVPGLESLIDQHILRTGYATGLDRSAAVRNISATDYQRLHEEDVAYKTNNWLVEHLPFILAMKPTSLVDVGCGNGRFLNVVAHHVEKVTGLDWARSPLLTTLPQNATFQQTNVLTDAIPPADVCCSADVLEHFEPSALPALIRKLHKSARINYHVIACYDDGHSHCAVFNPGQWLALFQTIDPAYHLTMISPRRQRPDQLLCVVTNFAPAANPGAHLGPIAGNWLTGSGKDVRFDHDMGVKLSGVPVATWVPSQDRESASVRWIESGMTDLVCLSKDRRTLTIDNLNGQQFQVTRA
ncbi:class I SAM-dependent methyltransferase [Rhizobium sp. CSW-27]|uniref:class I SAM-dependent methyltransferase n=1 Tax=Rhizobium sp. CSW-27 TaxID=2839985 RepID=UPI001C030457|nr:class I SAM-dependent methyltransferase [Rhizobium sp. CSW-27]MBT9371938.1 class I SAM-dependent methyltransferase [Rhizobium sp. CSW-27]